MATIAKNIHPLLMQAKSRIPGTRQRSQNDSGFLAIGEKAQFLGQEGITGRITIDG